MWDLEADAHVMRVEKQDGRDVVYLDQTILYAQGGGQPYDTGVIKNDHVKFIVEEVRFVDGEVLHFGNFDDDSFKRDEAVHIIVDADRRKLHARLHSAGHVVDMAVSQLCPDWIPGKGYHFPDSPYVEYDGQIDFEKRDELIADIAKLGNEFIKQAMPVSFKFVNYDELKKLCRHIPENIPTNKPTRVVIFDNFAVPCGGTHVKNLAELEELTITKIKNKDGKIRVGYNVSR